MLYMCGTVRTDPVWEDVLCVLKKCAAEPSGTKSAATKGTRASAEAARAKKAFMMCAKEMANVDEEEKKGAVGVEVVRLEAGGVVAGSALPPRSSRPF